MEMEREALGKAAVSVERIGALSCFNGVGGSGREAAVKLEATTASVIAEIGLQKLVPAEVMKIRAESLACFNGVGGSGREIAALTQKA